jgi:hypothetical protein
MTRKDYEAIASRLREYRKDLDGHPQRPPRQDTLDDIVEILVDFFTEDNPRFTADRFRKATQ